MSSLGDHLRSSMFTDDNGASTGTSMFGLGGTWAAHGQPRWKGYLLWGVSILGGLVLALTPGAGGFDLIAFGGVMFIIVGVVGSIEVLRGRPFRRLG